MAQNGDRESIADIFDDVFLRICPRFRGIFPA